ncbi:MAG: hypothetical protein IH622_13565 [Ochrobactrum anthropi]|uniref:Uncharacterized protein n=1 Tax=Brucella anthropi TaxID=529 RepID=A0A8I0T9W6_BRUAN|nr:hypothetical protein [Brucella anthropi]MBE0561825.1 hypothetical protein [Brucella anthropi]
MASEDLLKKAVAAFNALSPEQQAEMLEEQRQSWVRGNVGLSRDERDMTSPMMSALKTVREENSIGRQAVKAWADSKTHPTPVAPVSPDATGKCGELVANVWALVKPDGNLVEVTRYASMADLWRERGYHPAEYVTRSQAVELLAAERAEKARLKSENDAQADQISELQMTPWPEWATKVLAVIRKRSGYDGYGDAIEGVDLPAELDECIAAIEADNAALTARVKELEEHCELLCDPTIIRLEKENSDLEAKLTAAEKALKSARPYVEDYDTRRHNTGVDETLTQIDAALGGKP